MEDKPPNYSDIVNHAPESPSKSNKVTIVETVSSLKTTIQNINLPSTTQAQESSPSNKVIYFYTNIS
jgi:hypothetical protein